MRIHPQPCADCNREPKEGECFIMFLDPKSEWWLTLCDNPHYCQDCADKRKGQVKP